MEKREQLIRLWFQMWLEQKDLGISDLFTEDAVYAESWGPEYHGSAQIAHWFEEWNTRGKVLIWEIGKIFHKDSWSAVEWIFQNRMNDGTYQSFDGMSLIQWSQDGRISFLKEFGCRQNRYDPYADGPSPRFRDEPSLWF